MPTQVHAVAEVLEGVQHAKAGAGAFCTNFFPVQSRLQAWIDHGELQMELRPGVALFLRKDRDFWHLYCCAASPDALQKELTMFADLKTERIVTDVVGTETAVVELLACLEKAGFRPYTALQRMARPGGPVGAATRAADTPEIGCADPADSPAILNLLEAAFDRYGEQLPILHEIDDAVRNRQVLVAKRDGRIAGLLFHETHGLASTLRFWAVAPPFRTLRVGSALMSHYLDAQTAVRRFILWVNSSNENAIRKYQHFGYRADGLVDRVLANKLIPA